MDQTGVVLVPGGNKKTYEVKGFHQVLLHGKDEKRAFIAVLSVAATGKILLIQSVWKGKTKDSQPSESATRNALEKGHRFTSNPRTYWSSFETSKKWVEEILFSYQERMIAKHGFYPEAKLILYLDCWTVHRSKEF